MNFLGKQNYLIHFLNFYIFVILIIKSYLIILFKNRFDIMLDENLNSWLLEVNHTPSFHTDSPLDL